MRTFFRNGRFYIENSDFGAAFQVAVFNIYAKNYWKASKIFCNISAGGLQMSKNLQALFMDAIWLIYRSLTYSVIVGEMYSMLLKGPDIFSRQYRVPRA